VAVIGTGADIVYPGRHHALAHRIVDAGGAIVSEFALGTPGLPNHFPRRNRIIAALSRGVLVVEAAERSGSLITARLASEIGGRYSRCRDRSTPSWRGCHKLIRQGAKLVETPADVFEEFGDPGGRLQSLRYPYPIRRQRHPFGAALAYDPVTFDALCERSGSRPCGGGNRFWSLSLGDGRTHGRQSLPTSGMIRGIATVSFLRAMTVYFPERDLAASVRPGGAPRRPSGCVPVRGLVWDLQGICERVCGVGGTLSGRLFCLDRYRNPCRSAG
jgi:hypothetical protein